MNHTEGGHWTRRLSDYEELMCKCYSKGFMRIRYQLILNSKQALNSEIVKTALLHLHRKVPTLKICFSPRENEELWFKKMRTEEIDFKMIGESDYSSEEKAILSYNFNTGEGPLWCARMSESSRKCPIAEVKGDFPHQYNFLLAFHHTITDGTSNVAICNLFLNILNDIIGKKPINDEEQLGYHGDESVWQELYLKVSKEIAEDQQKQAESIEYYTKCTDAQNVLLSLFPFTDAKDATESLHYDFDPQETKNLVTISRNHGVTLNSFMSTIIAASVIEVLKKELPKKKLQEEYAVPNGQLVNARRYLETSNKIHLGCFATPLCVITNVSLDIEDTFWEHAKRFDTELRERLNNYAPLEQEIIMKLNKMEDPFLSDDPNELYNLTFAISNMGNLSRTFPGTGDHVQATYLGRITRINKVYSVHEMQTFRGRLFYSFDYNPKYLTKEKSQMWLDTIINLIHQKLNE